MMRPVVTFCVSRRRRKMCCGHASLCVCLSAAVRPHYCTDPDVTWGHGRGCPLVVHYWADLQSGHGLRCYGNITRTLLQACVHSAIWRHSANGRLGGVCARCWRVTGCVLKIACRIWEVGVAGSPVIGPRRGAFWTLLRRRGLRASTGGVMATKRERKMLASTCLCSFYS